VVLESDRSGDHTVYARALCAVPMVAQAERVADMRPCTEV